MPDPNGMPTAVQAKTTHRGLDSLAPPWAAPTSEALAFSWVTALAEGGITAEMDFDDRSLKSQMKRADRLEERGELPFIVIDAAEQVVDIPVLQFPLWLAFAAGPGEIDAEADLY